MYARQYHQIGLHGIFDNLKDIVTGGLNKYQQIQQDRAMAVKYQREIELARARTTAERASSERISIQSIARRALGKDLTIPLVIGVSALGLYFYMKR